MSRVCHSVGWGSFSIGGYRAIAEEWPVCLYLVAWGARQGHWRIVNGNRVLLYDNAFSSFRKTHEPFDLS